MARPGRRAVLSTSVVVDIAVLAEAIDTELQAGGRPERAEKERAYLKSELRHYGTSVPAIREVAKATARRYPEVTHEQLVASVDVLWAEPVHERRMACVELLDLYCDRLGPDGEAERPAALHAGELVVVPRGTWHRCETPEAVTVLSVTPQPTDHSSDRPS